jgi:hypothetical protein
VINLEICKQDCKGTTHTDVQTVCTCSLHADIPHVPSCSKQFWKKKVLLKNEKISTLGEQCNPVYVVSTITITKKDATKF